MEGDRSVVCLQVVAGPRNNRKCIVRGPAPWSAARLAARPDDSIVAPAAGGSGDRVETRSLCQICDRLGLIPDHSRIFRRMRPLGAGLATASTYAYLRRPRPRSENPGVGGSIPSQPTIVFSPAGNDLARAARTRRSRRALLTRTVLELTRFVRVAFVRGMTGAAGAWASWSVWSFAAPSFSIASSTIA